MPSSTPAHLRARRAHIDREAALRSNAWVAVMPEPVTSLQKMAARYWTMPRHTFRTKDREAVDALVDSVVRRAQRPAPAKRERDQRELGVWCVRCVGLGTHLALSAVDPARVPPPPSVSEISPDLLKKNFTSAQDTVGHFLGDLAEKDPTSTTVLVVLREWAAWMRSGAVDVTYDVPLARHVALISLMVSVRKVLSAARDGVTAWLARAESPSVPSAPAAPSAAHINSMAHAINDLIAASLECIANPSDAGLVALRCDSAAIARLERAVLAEQTSTPAAAPRRRAL